MVDQGIAALRLTRVQGLLQSIEHEVGPHRATDTLTDDSAGENVGNEGCVHEALQGRDVGESADPPLVRPLRPELTVDAVERAWCLRIGNRRAHDLAAHHALKPGLAHQALAGRFDSAPHAGKSAAREHVPSACR